jgi:phosphohistidine phosphatase
VIFSSPLVRALETAEIVADAMRTKKRLQLTEHLKPARSSKEQVTWLKAVRPAPAKALLVGHEPNFSELASYLLTGDERMSINFKKAGLCKVTADHLRAGGATLEWFLTPRQMEMIR